jgi:hypothetical protein
MVGRVGFLTASEQTVVAAAAAFLAQPSLARSTRRSYDQTLTRLVRELGQRPAAVHAHRGGDHRRGHHRVGWAGAGDLEPPGGHRPLVPGVLPPALLADRRPHGGPRAPAGAGGPHQGDPLPELERLWRREDVSVREKALRLLYETAARASEALAINVEDLELENKRVRIRSKGGDTDWLHFQAGAARLLPRLIRRAHPLAIVPGRPAPGPGSGSGHGRSLSGDGPGAAELPARRGAVPGGLGRVDAAPSAPLGPHPFG